MAGGKQGRPEYYAFDLLYLDGYDLRATPQIERKRLLKKLFERHDLDVPVRYSEHLTGDGQEMFAHAAKLNWGAYKENLIFAARRPLKSDGLRGHPLMNDSLFLNFRCTIFPSSPGFYR